LASVFEVHFKNIQDEPLDGDPNFFDSGSHLDESLLLNLEEQEALAYAKRIKELYEVSACYAVIFILFLILFHDYLMAYLIFAALGICIILQGLFAFEVFAIFSPKYERKLAEKKLGRKI